MTTPLKHLVARAARLAGNDLCAADGCDWVEGGGRPCPWDPDMCCSQPVYQCSRCGDYDYGEPGGPGFESCLSSCDDLLSGLTESEAAELLRP